MLRNVKGYCIDSEENKCKNIFAPIHSRREFALRMTAAAATALMPGRVLAQSSRFEEDSCEIRNSSNSIMQVCNAVSSQLSATDSGDQHLQFSYRKILFDRASADPRRDPPVHVAKKMRHLWTREGERFVCNQLGSLIENGSLLKLAVEKRSSDFIDDVTRRWNLWPNFIDNSGETVLDYIDKELASPRSGPDYFDGSYGVTLRRYELLPV